jgi:hypothetical protein
MPLMDGRPNATAQCARRIPMSIRGAARPGMGLSQHVPLWLPGKT